MIFHIFHIRDLSKYFFLTSVFLEVLNFMAIGHNLACISILALAAGGSYGAL